MHANFTYDKFDEQYDTQLYVPISDNVQRVLTRSFFHPRPSDELRHYRLRHNFLTASNVAAVLGMNPYCTIQTIMDKYMRPFSPAPDNYFTKRGKDMEPFIAQKFVRSTKIPCIHNQGLVQHRTYKFLGATFDLLTHTGIPVEIKCLVKRVPKQDEVMPKMYWVQCQIQMQVAESPFCYYVEYKERTETESEFFNIIVINRDDDWFYQVVPILERFWNTVTEYRSYFGKSLF